MLEFYYFKEVLTQKRDFRSDTSRNTVNIATESLKHGNDGQENKLGGDWYAKNDKLPTVNQILKGLK